MSTIKTGTTLTTAYVVEGDTTGALVIQTGSTPTTAMTISSAQVVTFSGATSYSGLATFTKGSSNGITIGDVTTNSNSVLRMQGTSAGKNWQIANNLNVAGLEFTPSTADGGTTYTTPAVTMLSSGNVGIGTAPSYKFDVLGATSRFYFDSTSNAVTLDGNGTNRDLTFYARYANTATLQTDGYWIFKTGNTERMRLDSSGGLLVNTTGVSSSGKFSVVQTGTGNAGAAISADATDSNFTYSIAYFNSTRAATSAFNFIKCTSGNYGPLQFQVTGNGVVYAQNTTIQSASDVRLKENIRDAEEGLQVIMGVRPVRFDFKEGFGNDRKNVLGFIAQEIETVFPDAVDVLPVDQDGEGPEEPYKSVGPGALIPVLVKAIQELNAKVNAQAAEIAALKGQ